MFGLRFVPSKCKMLFRDCVGSNSNRVVTGERVSEVSRFGYLGSCISLGGPISEEVSSHLQNFPLVFANSMHLWCGCDMQLSIKCRLYTIARSVAKRGG